MILDSDETKNKHSVVQLFKMEHLTKSHQHTSSADFDSNKYAPIKNLMHQMIPIVNVSNYHKS